MKPALVLQHGDWGPPALLGEWAGARGIPYVTHRVDLDHQLPELDGQPFIVSLGSDHSPRHSDVEDVLVELEFVKQAVDRDTPVLGLCYGGQVLAHVLGGTVEEAPEPELGWHRVSSEDPDAIPEGPWLQWHYDRFTLPPGAQQLATSPRAIQAFRLGPHLGLQFHPESTIEIVKEWARLDGARLAELGVADGEALAEAGRADEQRARQDAFRLFDAFWQRASQPERGES
ncbi:MAG TPA: type 1 glutamine amidotransferase [Solirubrobacteraceae bacterium]|jgi:GMP synthase-like glutamine amidotransferase|nr:type 1 glutamine amidotransferase [Solirubrobacteraceae bacterium]